MSEAAIKLISLWFPFIILIAVWIFFMSRLRRGTTFQKECLVEMKAQTASQAEMARHLDRIAKALEHRAP